MDVSTKKRIGIGIIAALAVIIFGGMGYIWTKFINIGPITSDIPETIEQVLETGDGASLPLTANSQFQVGIFASGLEQPREMISDPNGALITTITKQGRVVVLPDENQDGTADATHILLQNRTNPHGLALLCDEECTLYLAQERGIYSFNYNPDTYILTNEKKLIDLPPGERHTTRTLEQLSDTELLVSIGSSCDVCREENALHGTVQIFNIETKTLNPYARGLRNSVFMAKHPETGEIWATEMGRDFLGDDLPPDEINILKEDGNFGWPICFGNNVHDTVFDKNTYIRNPCMHPLEIPSYIDIPAHSAPLGLDFLAHDRWPQSMRDDLIVAFHGSWNRSEPAGYKLVWYDLDELGNLVETYDAVTGWLVNNKESIGRPAGVHLGPDGTLYVSDDKSGAIYTLIPNPEAPSLELES